MLRLVKQEQHPWSWDITAASYEIHDEHGYMGRVAMIPTRHPGFYHLNIDTRGAEMHPKATVLQGDDGPKLKYTSYGPHIDLGVAGTRELLRQLKALHPDLRGVGGDRATGVRSNPDIKHSSYPDAHVRVEDVLDLADEILEDRLPKTRVGPYEMPDYSGQRYLYHGTSTVHLPGILSHGLEPRKSSEHPYKRTYVTPDLQIARDEAHMTVDGELLPGHEAQPGDAAYKKGVGGEPVVIAIDRQHPSMAKHVYRRDMNYFMLDGSDAFITRQRIPPEAITHGPAYETLQVAAGRDPMQVLETYFPYLFHGTSSEYVPSIQKHGLLGRRPEMAGKRGKGEIDKPVTGRVYATTKWDLADTEAEHTVKGDVDREAAGGQKAVVVIDRNHPAVRNLRWSKDVAYHQHDPAPRSKAFHAQGDIPPEAIVAVHTDQSSKWNRDRSYYITNKHKQVGDLLTRRQEYSFASHKDLTTKEILRDAAKKTLLSHGWVPVYPDNEIEFYHPTHKPGMMTIGWGGGFSHHLTNWHPPDPKDVVYRGEPHELEPYLQSMEK